MRQYLDLLAKVLLSGEERDDRTGVGTLGLFGENLRFNLRDGFPLVTTKRLHVKSIVAELLWMLRGETNVQSLQAQGVTIWDEWANEIGGLGPVYGAQWRKWRTSFGSIDQLVRVLYGLREDPFSRRHVISAWNVADLDRMALAPCHDSFQFHVSQAPGVPLRRRLSCMVRMRSCDVFIGLPFNIASYALLTHMFARACGYEVGDLVFALGDVHVYRNHLDQAREQLRRAPRPLPRLDLSGPLIPWEMTADDVCVVDYDAHPHIPAPIAV